MSNEQAALHAVSVMTESMARMDAERFTSVYADDARVWHNTSGQEQTKAENGAFLAETMKQFQAMEYRSIRRTLTANGIVQQHVLHATMANGHVLELPACLIVEMEGDKIKRIDEYFNQPG